MADLSDVTVEVLIQYWGQHVRKLAEAGVPLDRIAESMAKAALHAETESFVAFLRESHEACLAKIMGPIGSPESTETSDPGSDSEPEEPNGAGRPESSSPTVE